MLNNRGVIHILVVLILTVSSQAMAWWNEEWPYRLPIAFDTSAAGANIATGIDEATVLVKLHSGNFQDFFLLNQDLSDVRFLAADDKTPLDFQVESADLINQLVYIWVKVPKISGSLNTERIWMYYGNASATPVINVAPPYNAKVAAVYHFNDLVGGVRDASVNEVHTSLAGNEAAASAMIAGGVTLTGSQGIQTPVIPRLVDIAHAGATLSFWVKAGEPAPRSTLLALGDEAVQWSIAIEQNQLFLAANYNNQQSEPSVELTPGNWHHLAVTYNQGTMQLFLDGKLATSLAGVAAPVSTKISLGSALDNSQPFSGTIDELRIDAIARTLDDIKLQLASQSLMGSLLNFQQAEQLGSGSGGSGFWSVIIGSTESSGWTIIALLGVMAAISWMVMAGKAMFIRSVAKDNFAFLEQYRKHAGDDPALLDHADSEEDKDLEDSPILQALFGSHDHFQSSPIYRVYHRGIQEATSRLGRSVGARAAGLPASSINAIKAAIDAQMIREAQRMNSKMVLLTIAISGGPFLGLMGTVVGVMITFAAIAATGDVNISAIAPGVAAALLTTVAGLVVAIPALFGYNYLATRIKENISDMRVFADEFITRLAEYYGN